MSGLAPAFTRSNWMISPQPSTPSFRARNTTLNRKNGAKVDQYLMEVEKVQGFAKAWELRERFERGDVTLAELGQY